MGSPIAHLKGPHKNNLSPFVAPFAVGYSPNRQFNGGKSYMK
ncbi:MAG: hypothetical protein ALAOOOJD_00109 [bacterium]|nr:hypothetical protein [bacterium]